MNYRYFSPKPIFQLSYGEGSYECQLTLPPTAAFQTIVGPSTRNSNLSKQLVCLEACKKLHKMGALNDHLLPSVEEISESDMGLKSNASMSRAGTYPRGYISTLLMIIQRTVHSNNDIKGWPKDIDYTGWTLLVQIFEAINGLGVSILMKFVPY